MRILDNILTDRGSKYAVSGAPAADAAAVQEVLRGLKRTKQFSQATHNSWGLICSEGSLKNDDGESGAGMVILRMLEREELRDHVVIVTRWYGGKHLGGDRFRHVQEAVRAYIADLRGAG